MNILTAPRRSLLCLPVFTLFLVSGQRVAAQGNGPCGPAYLVHAGDSLWTIGHSCHIPVPVLKQRNRLGRYLWPGQTLLLAEKGPSTAAPPPGVQVSAVTSTTVYRVRHGDTLSGIASARGLSILRLATINRLTPPYLLMPEMLLQIPKGLTPRLASLVKPTTGPSPTRVRAVLEAEAMSVGVDQALLKAIAWRESSWRMIDAADGGIGVMQLMPETVHWLKSSAVPGRWDAHNLEANVHAGAVLLAVYSRLYRGDILRIATAYHGGLGAVGPHPRPEMKRYVQSVTWLRDMFRSQP